MSLQSISALKVLQQWGPWPDATRGRKEHIRPTHVDLPPSITRALTGYRSKQSNLETYISTLFAAVLTELWADCRKADARVAEAGAWVTAHVSERYVHHAVDRIDQADEGHSSHILYLAMPNKCVSRFGGIDVVALRDPQMPDHVYHLGVKKLKRWTNQVLVKLENGGSHPPLASSYPVGKTFLIAPFANVRTHQTELTAVQGLYSDNENTILSVLQPQFPIARVPRKPAPPTTLIGRKTHTGSIPQKYNRNLAGFAKPRPGSHAPLPWPSPEASLPVHETFNLSNPEAVLRAVELLEEGVVVLQSPPGTGDADAMLRMLEQYRRERPLKRILITAQTNVAVNALCERALSIFPPADGQSVVVRVGDEHRFDAQVKKASIGTLSSSASETSRDAIELKIGEHVENFKGGRMSEHEFEARVDRLKADLRNLKHEEASKERKRLDVLAQARYVFSTCGSAGSDRLKNHCHFDLIILHGANHVSEASSLVSLRHAPRVLLFGDHCQLQPIVAEANKWLGYNRSLYERLIDNGYPYLLLDTQRGFHPWIYRQVSLKVYDGKVADGNEDEVLALWPWQVRAPVWWPNTVIHVPGSEGQAGTSNVNQAEVCASADVLQALLACVAKDPVALSRGLRIAICSPYGAQAKALEAATKHITVPEKVKLRWGTTVALQDELFDVVLISTVRTDHPGFLSGIAEANVAVTRGTKLRIIIGNTHLLTKVGLWSPILACPTTAKMEWNAVSNPPLRYTHLPSPPPYKLISESR